MDALLHGHNPEERIVAVSPIGDHQMRVYVRGGDSVSTNDVEFFPFFLLSDASYLRDFSAHHWVKELSGRNFFRFICAFNRWGDMWEAIRHILDTYNQNAQKRADSFADLPILHLRPDPVSQFLLETGRTYFKGMEFHELRRLQLDIETYSSVPGRLSNPERIEDRILLITLSDNTGWEHVIDGRTFEEAMMLEEFVRAVQERDPDVIEGHNLLGFDLPYLLRRAALTNTELAIGRDGRSPRILESRPGVFAPANEVISVEITGRTLLDTLSLVQAYDVSKRRLESYGLKYVARYFAISRPDRVYITADRINWHWEHEPEKLIEYALDDVREVRHLSEILAPSTFYLARMVPIDFGTLSRVGASAKIESLILREYVRQKHSVPRPQVGEQRIGGFADIFYRGVLGPVVHVDIESLYPSIMIREKIAPKSDSLGVFSALLAELTRLRIETKRRLRESAGQHGETALVEALQASLKILINSFYGYLGYSKGLFNDYEAADRVTTRGQEILRALMTEIRKRGGRIIEVDTDGIYFVPPTDVDTEDRELIFIAEVSQVLPEEIKLAIGGRYQKMFSFKKKNYALLGYDNKIIVKGSSLISRALEPFGRNYINQCIECILTGNIARLHTLYVNLRKDLLEHRIPIKDLARTEVLNDTRTRYEEDVESGRRHRSASYEVAIARGLQWKPGARISYYITGTEPDVVGFKNCKAIDEWDPNFPDENVQYYLRRLDEFSRKFEEFFLPQDFRAIFSPEDLFGFTARGVNVITSPVQPEESVKREDEGSAEGRELTIWLDDAGAPHEKRKKI